MPAEVLLRFIALTGVEPQWLLDGEGEKYRGNQQGRVENGSPDEGEPPPIDLVEQIARVLAVGRRRARGDLEGARRERLKPTPPARRGAAFGQSPDRRSGEECGARMHAPSGRPITTFRHLVDRSRGHQGWNDVKPTLATDAIPGCGTSRGAIGRPVGTVPVVPRSHENGDGFPRHCAHRSGARRCPDHRRGDRTGEGRPSPVAIGSRRSRSIPPRGISGRGSGARSSRKATELSSWISRPGSTDDRTRRAGRVSPGPRRDGSGAGALPSTPVRVRGLQSVIPAGAGSVVSRSKTTS